MPPHRPAAETSYLRAPYHPVHPMRPSRRWVSLSLGASDWIVVDGVICIRRNGGGTHERTDRV